MAKKYIIVFVICLFCVNSKLLLAQDEQCQIYNEKNEVVSDCNLGDESLSNLPDGRYTIKSSIIDEAGNRITTTSNPFFVDHNPPMIFFSKLGTTIQLYAHDTIDPKPSISYSINQEKQIVGDIIDFKSYEGKAFTLDVKTSDEAGNSAKAKLDLKVDKGKLIVTSKDNITMIAPGSWQAYLDKGEIVLVDKGYEFRNEYSLSFLITLILFLPLLLIFYLARKTAKMRQEIVNNLYRKGK